MDKSKVYSLFLLILPICFSLSTPWHPKKNKQDRKNHKIGSWCSHLISHSRQILGVPSHFFQLHILLLKPGSFSLIRSQVLFGDGQLCLHGGLGSYMTKWLIYDHVPVWFQYVPFWGDTLKRCLWAPVSFPSFPANAQKFYSSVGLWSDYKRMQEQEPINELKIYGYCYCPTSAKSGPEVTAPLHRGTRSCAAFLPESLSKCWTHRWNSQKSIIPMHQWCTNGDPDFSKTLSFPAFDTWSSSLNFSEAWHQQTTMVPSWTTASQQGKPGLLFFEKLLTLLLQLFFGLLLRHGSNMMWYIYNVHNQAAPVWLQFLSIISKPEDSSHFKGSSESFCHIRELAVCHSKSEIPSSSELANLPAQLLWGLRVNSWIHGAFISAWW